VAAESLASLQARLAAQGAPPSHLQRIAALRELAERSPACLALALVGSYAQGKGDRISDLDLLAVVAEGGSAAFIEQAHAVLSSSDVLHDCAGAFRGKGCFRKYVFLDFSSCELAAIDAGAAPRLWRPFVAVWDPQDRLDGYVVEGPPPRHEDFEPYPHGDDGLIWELVDCIKWIKRGRMQLAKDYLRRLGAKLD
jgi:predicted nucleotidyltransferase